MTDYHKTETPHQTLYRLRGYANDAILLLKNGRTGKAMSRIYTIAHNLKALEPKINAAAAENKVVKPVDDGLPKRVLLVTYCEWCGASFAEMAEHPFADRTKVLLTEAVTNICNPCFDRELADSEEYDRIF